jgi:hypothetical protein
MRMMIAVIVSGALGPLAISFVNPGRAPLLSNVWRSRARSSHRFMDRVHASPSPSLLPVQMHCRVLSLAVPRVARVPSSLALSLPLRLSASSSPALLLPVRRFADKAAAQIAAPAAAPAPQQIIIKEKRRPGEWRTRFGAFMIGIGVAGVFGAMRLESDLAESRKALEKEVRIDPCATPCLRPHLAPAVDEKRGHNTDHLCDCVIVRVCVQVNAVALDTRDAYRALEARVLALEKASGAAPKPAPAAAVAVPKPAAAAPAAAAPAAEKPKPAAEAKPAADKPAADKPKN